MGNPTKFKNKKEGAQLQYLINIMCKFGWILLSSLGGVVDKRWVTPSDPENSYFDVGNCKKKKDDKQVHNFMSGKRLCKNVDDF